MSGSADWLQVNSPHSKLATYQSHRPKVTEMYAFVEFLNDNSVEVVPKAWLLRSGKEDYCYWPKNNPAGKAKKMRIPDVEAWDRYPVRIFCDAETYGKGKLLAKRAEDTSNLESEAENEKGRKRKKNNKFMDTESESEDDDETDEEQPPAKKATKTPIKQTPPPFPLVGNESGSAADSEMPRITKKSRNTTPRSSSVENTVHMTIEKVIASPPPNSQPQQPCTPQQHSRTALQQPYTPGQPSSRWPQQSSAFEPQQPYTPRQPSTPRSQLSHEFETAETVDNLQTPSSTSKSSNNSFQISMLRRLMTMENQLKDNSCMLQRILNVLDVREDVVNPLIEDPVNSIDELTELNQKLEDKDYAKQMVSYLSTLGGTDEGDCTRRIMRKLATNFVWSHYSSKGQKGKQKLENMKIYDIIKRAFKRNWKNASEKLAEIHIGNTLKQAPLRPGGINILAVQNQENQENQADED